jgi:lipopolysaccharide/colanic/teichoic acid biosynthesis glycosyltransferase
MPPERVLILGTGPAACSIAEEIQNTPKDHYLLGLLDDQHGFVGAPRVEAQPPDDLIVGTIEELDDAIGRLRPDRIIVALSTPGACLPIGDRVPSSMNTIAVETAVEAQERLTGKLAIETLPLGALVFAGSRRYRMLKRTFSVTVAAIGLVLSAPLMVLIAVLLKLDSRGPVFFVQERIGLRGRRFRLIKFRSMLPEAGSTSEWARDHADRITRVGRWLRKYHLDELPQFINILRGDMELVGPRPYPLSNHELFHREIPHYALRAETCPGLTGWAQVRNGYANDLAGEMEKMRYDLYYLTHQSIALDLWIVVETIKIVIFGREPAGRRGAKRPSRIRQPSSVWAP